MDLNCTVQLELKKKEKIRKQNRKNEQIQKKFIMKNVLHYQLKTIPKEIFEFSHLIVLSEDSYFYQIKFKNFFNYIEDTVSPSPTIITKLHFNKITNLKYLVKNYRFIKSLRAPAPLL